MLKKVLHALALAAAHVAVLLAAHGIAEHVGREIILLVRDEWVVAGVSRAVEIAWGP